MRVVSFLPSATEMVYALGQGGLLVGRSHECDHPAEALGLPVVMRPRLDLTGKDSRQIDSLVSDAMQRHQELYEVDEERLRSLAPDLVLTQDLCAVCSVTPGTLKEALDKLSPSPKVLTLSPTRLAHLFRDLEAVAQAFGVPDRGRTLVAESQRRLSRAHPDATDREPVRVLVLEWLDPPMVAGLWVPDQVREAGGVPLLARAGAPGRRTDWDTIRGLGADLLVVAPCGYPLSRTVQELARAPAHPLGDLHPGRGVWLADEAFFSRPGPRLLEGVELLSDLLSGTGRPRRAYENRARPAFRDQLFMNRVPSRRRR
jgi:iron complex transport system substrate-binding protein